MPTQNCHHRHRDFGGSSRTRGQLAEPAGQVPDAQASRLLAPVRQEEAPPSYRELFPERAAEPSYEDFVSAQNLEVTDSEEEQSEEEGIRQHDEAIANSQRDGNAKQHSVSRLSPEHTAMIIQKTRMKPLPTVKTLVSPEHTAMIIQRSRMKPFPTAKTPPLSIPIAKPKAENIPSSPKPQEHQPNQGGFTSAPLPSPKKSPKKKRVFKKESMGVNQ